MQLTCTTHHHHQTPAPQTFHGKNRTHLWQHSSIAEPPVATSGIYHCSGLQLDSQTRELLPSELIYTIQFCDCQLPQLADSMLHWLQPQAVQWPPPIPQQPTAQNLQGSLTPGCFNCVHRLHPFTGAQPHPMALLPQHPLKAYSMYSRTDTATAFPNIWIFFFLDCTL